MKSNTHTNFLKDNKLTKAFSNIDDCLKQTDRWYVFTTQARQEQFAVHQLEKKSFQAYIPMILTTVRHARKSQTKHVPLFPGYGFVKCDKNMVPLRAINTTQGVSYLITNNERPAAVPPGIIPMLKSMTGKNGIVSFEPPFDIGDKVRFINGPFVDLVGCLSKIDNKGRVNVLLSLLCGKVKVKAHSDSLIRS